MKHFTPETFQNCTLGLLLGRAHLVKDRILDTHLMPFGITAAQFKVLIIMSQFSVDTPAELCRYLSLDSGAMTRMLDRLEQKDLIARRRCENDRRQVRLALTVEGGKVVDHLPVIGAEAMNELVGALEPEELAMLERLLTKMLLAAGDALTELRMGSK
ncbi:MarR family winged helix-turn-helix transcriptional regulator [Pseudomonas sp. R5(2019)]|uniref:MarR family winged helix-turn-helix transcriptional regulator n=1 Tax=Pseudomonas sp. R5(2019) TaxID=2697566 RepID=UPI001411D65A|nr:MarR family transcriptional regulator [Pseudomonas sp. R5(2019)]NBA95918.1 MarR family transcriptional regulator [Pseudomonas sp. R5(2019)]